MLKMFSLDGNVGWAFATTMTLSLLMSLVAQDKFPHPHPAGRSFSFDVL